MPSFERKQAIRVEPERDLLPLNVLLHCRTVVEKKNFVSTGVMTNVDGEMFEVELHEFSLFELGEAVKLTVYSPAGIQSIQTMVIAKYEGAIALLQPTSLNKRFKERREHPRVDTDGKVYILSRTAEDGTETPLDEPHLVRVQDISLTGLGFVGEPASFLTLKSKLKVKIDIGLEFYAELDIIRQDRTADEIVCGSKMKITDEAIMRPLRALILKLQVEKQSKARRRDLLKSRNFSN